MRIFFEGGNASQSQMKLSYYNGSSWTDCDVDDGIMKPDVDNDFQSFEESTTEPEVQARFPYRRQSDNTAHYLAFRPLDINSTGERIEVAFFKDKVQLREHDGTSWINVQTDTGFTSAINTWYDVFVVVEKVEEDEEIVNTTVAVWRRGEHESDITRILFREDLELLTTERRMFRVNENSDWWVDDVGWDVNNFDYFLHLSVPTSSPFKRCIDTGDPNKTIGSLDGFVDFERDFDDVFRQFDIFDYENNLNPVAPMTETVKSPHDMGAKEYPIPANSLYWSANPLFE